MAPPALVAEAPSALAAPPSMVLASADAGAEAAAEADRAELLAEQGIDVNHAGEKIDRIRVVAEGESTPVELRSP